MGIIFYAQKVSLLLGGRLSIKSSLIQRCFSTLQTSPSGGTTRPLSDSPWLMVPPTLVADHDETDIVRSPTFKVKRNSEVKPDDNNYYHFLNVADNKLDFKKKKKDIWLPWSNDYFSPHESTFIGSSHGWLAYIHPHNCTPYLYNPFSDSAMPYLPLPPIETLPNIHSSRRLNLTHMDKEFEIRYQWLDEDYPDGRRQYKIQDVEYTVSGREFSKKLFSKVVMSRAPNEYTDCTVMAIYHDPPSSKGRQKLVFCRIGDSSWTVLDSPSESYSDIVYSTKKNCFYAVNSDTYSKYWLECCDLTDPSSPHRFNVCRQEPNYWYREITDTEYNNMEFYLVESSAEEFLAVARYYQYLHDKFVIKAFEVFKLDDYGDWRYMPNIGDRTLFVGDFQSVSLPAHDFPGLRKNCIYFIVRDNYDSNKSTELGVYNLQAKRIEYSFDLEGIEPSPVWVIPHH